MSAALVVYLTLLFAGIGLLVCAIAIARTNWRTDIPPFGFGTSSLAVFLHPGRFVRAERVAAVRALARLGAAMLLVATAIAAIEIIRSMTA